MALNDFTQASRNKLTDQVLKAQYRVTELQAKVSALTEKQSSFAAHLETIKSRLDQTRESLKTAVQIGENIVRLNGESTRAYKRSDEASAFFDALPSSLAALVQELAFITDLRGKLASRLNKLKSVDPLIPDELVTLVAKSDGDVQSALMLALNGIQGTSDSVLTGQDALHGLQFVNDQVSRLDVEANHSASSLEVELTNHCELLEQKRKIARRDLDLAVQQLSEAKTQLSEATSQLTSYEQALDSVASIALDQNT